ncbi:unnamed protein product [Musa banksii]
MGSTVPEVSLAPDSTGETINHWTGLESWLVASSVMQHRFQRDPPITRSNTSPLFTAQRGTKQIATATHRGVSLRDFIDHGRISDHYKHK